MYKRFVLLAMTMAVAVAAIGCGGGDDGAAEAAPTPSKAQFVKAADQICERDSREIPKQLLSYQRRAAASGQPQGELFEEAVEDVLLPILNTRLDAIRALGVPRGDQQEVEAFLGAMEKGVEVNEKQPASTLAEFEKPFQPAIKLGRGYGFERCAR